MADGNTVPRIDSRKTDDKQDAKPSQSEAPSAPKPAPVVTPAAMPPAAPKRKRSLVRPVLFALLPIALVVGGYYYVTGGQVVETDNAYVQAATVGVSTDVAGTVIEIDVTNNQRVRKGDILYRLRQDTYKIALAGAQAQLGTVRNQVLTLQASYTLAVSQIEQARTDIPYYETNFKRQQDLQSSSAASKANYDTAKHDLDAARQKVLVAQSQAQAMLAQLGGDASLPVEQNPFYLQAKSAVDSAQRDLNDTVVKAPFDGIVTNVDNLQLGAYLQASQQAFNLVSTEHMWVEASPKETELTYVKPGQPVTVSVDTYPGVEWRGKVDTISPASSSSFSLLPAQNTSGNWVKVVQRIPMRVALDPAPDNPPLRVGMSVEVSVDTGHARGLPAFVDKWLGRGQAAHE
ncbi:HlyD family secretion protein [Labrys monachus]|uniref:Membrane fusion protein (Multidrug efflux system) n=1 Tax=Labrys monachus TaxID=217067 RepID=A0ABU0F9R2_9HYPH|nr:HlyD family secretion protein [Labrys monachus]MDQ0391171.1 membrane fusion protein (multidrug efflux system) [Labrys monachus]